MVAGSVHRLPIAHAPAVVGLTTPDFSLSFSRYESPRMLTVVAVMQDPVEDRAGDHPVAEDVAPAAEAPGCWSESSARAHSAG